MRSRTGTQTDTLTDTHTHTHTHTDARDHNTFRVVYAPRNVKEGEQ